MALGDVTHDRALPRNLLYSQNGGGEGTDFQEFSFLSGLFLFLGVWLCFNRIQEKPHL
jgi:hypothetical protein